MRQLVGLLEGRPFVALTGAGMSTESGIPDYRGPASAGRVRTPIQHRDFLRDPATRQRYWARSAIGWERFREARPNRAHIALADLERRGLLRGIITQNVDRLHHRAGSERVIELHGALEEVCCLGCGSASSREVLQTKLREHNPTFFDFGAKALPDGDADLDPSHVAAFRVVDCDACGGVLKPKVVFFGDNVPRPIVDRSFEMVEAMAPIGGVLLVLGTSLTVFSGYRFVRRASEMGVDVAIVNIGPTRGDPLARVCVDASLGDVLEELSQALESTASKS